MNSLLLCLKTVTEYRMLLPAGVQEEDRDGEKGVSETTGSLQGQPGLSGGTHTRANKYNLSFIP